MLGFLEVILIVWVGWLVLVFLVLVFLGFVCVFVFSFVFQLLYVIVILQ